MLFQAVKLRKIDEIKNAKRSNFSTEIDLPIDCTKILHDKLTLKKKKVKILCEKLHIYRWICEIKDLNQGFHICRWICEIKDLNVIFLCHVISHKSFKCHMINLHLKKKVKIL